MAVSAAHIAAAAEAEWRRWGGGVWNLVRHTKSAKYGRDHPNGFHIDDEPDFAKIVREVYCRFVIKEEAELPSLADISTDHYAWSAVTISYIMGQAGFDRSRFQFSQSHSRYIRNAIADRKAGRAASYWGYRITEAGAAPDIGDLIGYARKEKGDVSFEHAQGFFDKTGGYMGHSDIVVAKGDGHIEVIGGNVSDSVLKKVLPIGADGLLADRTMPWFVVMKLRG